jgi:hypothetical protein
MFVMSSITIVCLSSWLHIFDKIITVQVAMSLHHVWLWSQTYGKFKYSAANTSEVITLDHIP